MKSFLSAMLLLAFGTTVFAEEDLTVLAKKPDGIAPGIQQTFAPNPEKGQTEPFVDTEDFESGTDPVRFWTSYKKKYTVNYKGTTDEKARSGKQSFKLDVTFNEDSRFLWQKSRYLSHNHDDQSRANPAAPIFVTSIGWKATPMARSPPHENSRKAATQLHAFRATAASVLHGIWGTPDCGSSGNAKTIQCNHRIRTVAHPTLECNRP